MSVSNIFDCAFRCHSARKTANQPSIPLFAQDTPSPEVDDLAQNGQLQSEAERESATITAAIIAAVASIIAAIFTAVFGWLNQTKLATLQGMHQHRLALLQEQIDIRKRKEDARTTYESDARKRLYEQSEPILFQLLELSEDAFAQILKIAQDAREGKMGYWSHDGLLSDPKAYTLKSAVYRLLAPMAAFEIFQTKLTQFDLLLDPYVTLQYDIAKAIRRTFYSDFELAESAPQLPYNPLFRGISDEEKEKKRKEDPAQYSKQGLFKGVFEKLVYNFIIETQDKTKIVRRYAEYDNEYFTKYKTPSEELQIMINRLSNFHPKAYPVLWRILITQALLYDALKNIRKNKTTRPYIKTLSSMTEEQKKQFDWRGHTTKIVDEKKDYDEIFFSPFNAAENYLKNNEKELYDRLTEKELVRSLQKVRSEHGENGEQISNALINVAKFIEKSGDPAIIALFHKLDQELYKLSPDRPTLRKTWSAIEELIPTISMVPGITWIRSLLI